MADLLRKWLREDIGCEVVCDTFEEELASGYVLGRIMAHLNMQPDFDKFDASGTPDARINNFTRLQDSLLKLGIRLDSRMANAIMTEEKGVAARLLYTIKVKTDALHKNLAASRRSTQFATRTGVETRPSYAVLEKQAHRTEKQRFEESRALMFEDIMRTKVGNPKMILESLHLEKFHEEQLQQQRAAQEGYTMERQAKRAAQDAFREQRINLMQTVRTQRVQQQREVAAAHKGFLDSRKLLEREELRVELTLAERTLRQTADRHRAAAKDVARGIDAFEANLQRLGAEQEVGGEHDEVLPPLGATPLEHMRTLRSLAPEKRELLLQSEAYMGSLKERRREDVLVRREREARRRRMVVEQEAAQLEMDRKTQLEGLMQTLERQSREEQRVAEELWRVRQEKEIMYENRKLREEQYAARREADWEEAIRREVEAMREMRARHNRLHQEELEQVSKAKERQAAQEKRRIEAECRGVVEGLCTLAERCAGYREATGMLVPRKEYHEWVALFLEGHDSAETPTGAAGGVQEDGLQQGADGKPSAMVLQYLQREGEWGAEEAKEKEEKEKEEGQGEGEEAAEAEPLGNPELAAVLLETLRVSEMPDQKPDLPDLSAMPLKLALVGAPFSGKSSVAMSLAQEYGLQIITPEGAVERAVAAGRAADEASQKRQSQEGDAGAEDGRKSEEEEEGEEEGGSKEEVNPEVVKIGQRCLDLTTEGEEIPDELIVRLIAIEIGELGARLAKESEGESQDAVQAQGAGDKKGGKADDKKKKKDEKKKEDKSKGKKGKDAAWVPPVATSGFILDGFPRTLKQAKLLEKQLTGLDTDRIKEVDSKASILAPPKPSDLELDPALFVSGLDGVFAFAALDESACIDRAKGRRVDPETGRVFHVELNPPPTNEPGLLTRLTEPEDASNDSAVVLARLEAHGREHGPLMDWFLRFEKLVTDLDSSCPIADALERGRECVERLKAARQSAAEVEAAAKEVDRILQAVQEAQARAQAAMDSAEAAAADLFAAKKAEVEAQALLAGETKPAKGKKGADAASAPGSEEAKAQELIRQNASAACADALKRAEEQAAAAAAAAKEAEEMLESAREALDAASTGQGDDLIESSVQARAAAEAASEKVRALVASAGQAAEAAAEAQKGAERALRQARRAAEHAGNPDELPAEDDEVAEAGSGEGAGADGAEGEAAGAGEETGEGGVEVKAEESVESRLRSLARGMGKEEAGSCWDAWRSGEARYLAALEELFGRVRRERADNVQYVAEKRAAMLAMLHAKDDRQSAVDTALEEIRSRVPDLFQDAAVRCEAVEAVDRMRDALWDMCDVKNSEADKSRKAVAGETYLAEHEKATVALFVEMIHVEMARLKDTAEATRQLARSVHKVMAEPAPVQAPPEDGVAPSPELATAIRAEQALGPIPGLEALEKAHPALAAVARTAMGYKAMLSSAKAFPERTVTPQKGAEEPTPEVLEEHAKEAAALETYRGIIVTECATSATRITAIVQRCAGAVGELHGLVKRLHARLEEWAKESYHGECRAVSNTAATLMGAIEGTRAIPAALSVTGRDFQAAALRCTAVVSVAAEITARPGVANGMARASDVAAAILAVSERFPGGGLPPIWAEAGREKIVAALRMLAYSGAAACERGQKDEEDPMLDWRVVLVSMLKSAFPALRDVEEDVLKYTLDKMKGADADADGMLTRDEFMGVEMWFEKSAEGLAILLDQIRGSKPAKAPQPKKSTRKTTETQSKSMDEANAAHLTESPTLKEAVFDVLCESNIEGIPRLHIVSALLKTVVGPDLDGALRKAWTVACGDAAGRAMAEQVACVVSGGATDAPGGSGCHVGRVRELVEEASAKEGGEGEEEEGEEEADEEEEKEEAKLSMADIMGAEAGPAWTLRQMVGWYKWVDLEAVLGREEAEEGEEAEGGGEGEGDGEQGEVGEEGEEGEE